MFTVRRVGLQAFQLDVYALFWKAWWPRVVSDVRYCVSAHCDSFEPRAPHGLQQHPRHLLLADRHVPPRAVFLSLFRRLRRLAQSFGNDPNGIIGEGVQRADLWPLLDQLPEIGVLVVLRSLQDKATIKGPALF